MPIKVSVGRKDPRFKEDYPSWNMTVSGPAELFTKPLEKFIFLHGLNGLNTGGEFNLWSSRYVIGSPMVYLGTLLAHKYGAVPDRDLARQIATATHARKSKDGLERFLGNSAQSQLLAGDQALSVRAGSQAFIVNCNEDDLPRREFLDGAGWLPVGRVGANMAAMFGTMPFMTRDPFIAANLEAFMSDDVRKNLKLRLAEASKKIAASKSQAAPEGFSVPVPQDIDYLPFQKGGIAALSGPGKSGIIADDMGLGKTIQGIGILNATPDAGSMIVFCQANMRLKWVREIEKWKVNTDLTVGHAEGNDWPDTDIVVINYDIASRHVENINARKWDIVLADEAHNLKNEEAQRTIAVLGDLTMDIEPGESAPGMVPLAKNGKLVHLTGTPKPNRISELWPLLTSSRPDIWGAGPEARRAFLNRYQPPVLIKKKFNKGDKEFTKILAMPGKPIRELELQMRLRGSGSFIRRMKRDTDLPPKFRTPIPIPYKLSKEDIEMLKSAETQLEQILAKARGISHREVTPGRTNLASELIDVISGEAIKGVDFSELARLRRNVGLIKAPLAGRFIVEELAEDNDLDKEFRRKTVVFAHHKDVIGTIADMARKELGEKSTLVYDGSITSSKKRQAIIDRFQEDDEARLIIISLSGATGITLTAACRMRVVEPDWAPSNMVQIEDRIWRIGQMQNVDIGYLFLPNSLDINVGMTLVEKMETDERALNSLSFRGMNARSVTKTTTIPKPEKAIPPDKAACPEGDTAEPDVQKSFSF